MVIQLKVPICVPARSSFHMVFAFSTALFSFCARPFLTLPVTYFHFWLLLAPSCDLSSYRADSA